ncbi:hypothetical protein [Gulosibacter faecalis]|jgi:hypothetical protein|uniref:MFS transporter permease n=1 Tax=Gulosibacter faecalis TaxID=272240 RepID=A0ABW5UXP6_9MICO|nr:hypothetical protein [Gulosibacter faecalis]
MAKRLHRILSPFLAISPFLVGAWTVVAWIVFQRSIGGFLGLFILVPLSFIQLGLLGIALWLRPTFRLSKKAMPTDAAWYFGSLVLWLVAVAIPGGWGGAAQLAAALFAGFAIVQLWRTSRKEAEEALRQRAERAAGASSNSDFGRSRGPQGGRVIIVDTNETWNERADGTAPDAEAQAIEAEILEEPRSNDDDEPDEWTARPHSTS